MVSNPHIARLFFPLLEAGVDPGLLWIIQWVPTKIGGSTVLVVDTADLLSYAKASNIRVAVYAKNSFSLFFALFCSFSFFGQSFPASNQAFHRSKGKEAKQFLEFIHRASSTLAKG